MNLCRHILLASALLVSGCSASADGQNTNTAQDQLPGPWQPATEDMSAPSPPLTAAPQNTAGAAVEGSTTQQPTPTAAPTVLGTPLPRAESVPEAPEIIQPLALRLPSIGVEGAVVRGVGVEPDGAMEIPPAQEVGWYRFGPGPGQAGSQVLAAHISSNGRDGVFRNLDKLESQDLVEVIDEEGTVHRYEVVQVEQYKKDQLPFDELFDREGSERLVLITCGGDWNPQLLSYDSNVVAYAVPTA